MPYSTKSDLRMVAIATDADSPTGFAICDSLIHRLAGLNAPSAFPWVPDTADPEDFNHAQSSQPYPQVDALTLILACQNRSDQNNIQSRLLGSIDGSMHTRNVGKYSFAAMFREKLVIEVETLDLGNTESVRGFSSIVKKRHKYLSHLVFCENPINRVKSLEKDPTGLQNPLFPSYLLCKLLEPTLCAYRAPPSRIIWAPSTHAVGASRALFRSVISRLDQEGPALKTLMQLDSAKRENAGGHEIPRIRHMVVSLERNPGGVRRSIGCASQVQQMLHQATDTLYRYSSSYGRESSNRNISSGVVDAALTPSVLLSSIAPRESHPKVVIDNSRARVPEEDSEELVKRLKEMEQSYFAES